MHEAFAEDDAGDAEQLLELEAMLSAYLASTDAGGASTR